MDYSMNSGGRWRSFPTLSFAVGCSVPVVAYLAPSWVGAASGAGGSWLALVVLSFAWAGCAVMMGASIERLGQVFGGLVTAAASVAAVQADSQVWAVALACSLGLMALLYRALPGALLGAFAAAFAAIILSWHAAAWVGDGGWHVGREGLLAVALFVGFELAMIVGVVAVKVVVNAIASAVRAMSSRGEVGE
jgi:hypothetical protein